MRPTVLQGGGRRSARFPGARGAGRTTERLLAMGQEMAAARGLDAGEEVFISLHRYLRDAGLRDVGSKEVLLPIGANVDFVGKRQQREPDLTD
jgi:hypothetical protein